MSAKLFWFIPLVIPALVIVNGCAEGPLWKTGYLSPRIRQQWQDEERIAATFRGKRQQMRELVDAANLEGREAQEDAAQQLSEVVTKDPIMLMRIEAVQLLGELPVEPAAAAVRLAAKDREVAVRRAAVDSLGNFSDDKSTATLASLARTDDNVDVRIAATGRLANADGPVAIQALQAALNDSNPAMQLRAADSLESITGEGLGDDIQAWQEFVQTLAPAPADTRAAEAPVIGDNDFRR